MPPYSMPALQTADVTAEGYQLAKCGRLEPCGRLVKVCVRVRVRACVRACVCVYVNIPRYRIHSSRTLLLKTSEPRLEH